MKNLNNPAYKAVGPKTVFLKWSINSILGWPAFMVLEYKGQKITHCRNEGKYFNQIKMVKILSHPKKYSSTELSNSTEPGPKCSLSYLSASSRSPYKCHLCIY